MHKRNFVEHAKMAVKSQTHLLWVAVAHRHHAVLTTSATGQLPSCYSKILLALLQTSTSKAELVPQNWLVTCAQQSLTQRYSCIPDWHPQETTSLAPAHIFFKTELTIQKPTLEGGLASMQVC